MKKERVYLTTYVSVSTHDKRGYFIHHRAHSQCLERRKASSYYMDSEDVGFLQETMVEIDIPLFDPRTVLTALLEDQRGDAIAKHVKAMAIIEDKIQQLKALPNLEEV